MIPPMTGLFIPREESALKTPGADTRMSQKEFFYRFVRGESNDTVPFFPDITDWYKARRTPAGESQKYPTGAFIPDDDPFHKVQVDMPKEYSDFTLLDFYRHFDWGLPVKIYYCYEPTYKEGWYEQEFDGVQVESEIQGNKHISRLICNLGTLEKVDIAAADGSMCPRKHWVESPEDLKVLHSIIERTKVIPRFDRILLTQKGVGNLGVVEIVIGRSPFGKLIHDYMGFQNLTYALVDDPLPIMAFLEFQREYDLQMIQLAAESPAKIVNISDHADQHLISPRYYERYCIPFYQEACKILHAGGKIVSSHLDGNHKNQIPLFPKTGFDLLDGCTPEPMSNYGPEDLAGGLAPHMKAYCGVPATLFSTGVADSEILQYGVRILASLKGKVILNVGDVLSPTGNIKQVIKLGKWAKEQ